MFQIIWDINFIYDFIFLKLDIKELKKIFRILKTRYNKTIIFVSNNLDFVLEVADYVYVLYDKEIVLEGKKIDVLSKTDILKKYGIIGEYNFIWKLGIN